MLMKVMYMWHIQKINADPFTKRNHNKHVELEKNRQRRNASISVSGRAEALLTFPSVEIHWH